VVYLDSSALVKLVVREAESAALIRFLERHSDRVSCCLARTEVVRAVSAQGGLALARARKLFNRIDLVALDDELLDDAGLLATGVLRSLDAIHLAAARSLGGDLIAVVTYDSRMATAATALGLDVASPS
jgi:predicted nucleic acid-binding protein